MNVPHKNRWKATASSGDPRLAIDDRYATTWISKPSKKAVAGDRPRQARDARRTRGLLGPAGAGQPMRSSPRSTASMDPSLPHSPWRGRTGRFRLPSGRGAIRALDLRDPQPERGKEIVEINLYGPADAASVLEEGRIAALGHAPVKLPAGESITVDFGYVRSPLGAFIEWGEAYGTVFSVHLSDDGKSFREVGRINTGDGGSDSFWWRSTTSRYFRLTVHEASSPEGAVVNELKLRILNKDRMPIGQFERAARPGAATSIRSLCSAAKSIGPRSGSSIRPRRRCSTNTAISSRSAARPRSRRSLRLGGALHGAPASAADQPIPRRRLAAHSERRLVGAGRRAPRHGPRSRRRKRWSSTASPIGAPRRGRERSCWRCARSRSIPTGSTAATPRSTRSPSTAGRCGSTTDSTPRFRSNPTSVAIADFDDGDVVRLIEKGPEADRAEPSLGLGLLSAACEFAFSLAPGESIAFVVSSPMRDGVTPQTRGAFRAVARRPSRRIWREKIGPRRITVGDREVSDTVEAQTALILVNATRTRLQARSAQLRPHLDSRRLLAGARPALGRPRSKRPRPMSSGTRSASTRTAWSRRSSTWTARSTGVTAATSNSTRRASLSASPPMSIASARDRAFLEAIFEPVVRATRFIEELCARTECRARPETRFHGLLAPSISHEGYSKPSYSYWDDYFALSAWRNCEYLAREIGDEDVAAHANAKGREFAANLTRSIRMTAEEMETGLIPGSADREDVDPTSTSIAFEPCRVEDVLPPEFVAATYDLCRRPHQGDLVA